MGFFDSIKKEMVAATQHQSNVHSDIIALREMLKPCLTDHVFKNRIEIGKTMHLPFTKKTKLKLSFSNCRNNSPLDKIFIELYHIEHGLIVTLCEPLNELGIKFEDNKTSEEDIRSISLLFDKLSCLLKEYKYNVR